MGLIVFAIFGLVVGLLARGIMPGRQRMGILMTTLLGVAGSFLGGFFVALITDNRITDLNTAGFLGSLLGALVLLLVGSRVGGHRSLT